MLAVCAAIGVNSFAQEVRQVRPMEVTGFGITYSLPLTVLDATVETTCTRIEAGIFAPFAEKYLGIEVPQEDQCVWSIDKISLASRGVADTTRTYHIVCKEKDFLPTFYLNDAGVLLSINTEPAPVEDKVQPENVPTEDPSVQEPVNVMTEELFRAGSKAKQAEIVATQIFRIRESRLNLLTGDVDNMPADGESFKLVLANLEAQEQAYMSLFTGVKTETKHVYHTEYIPTQSKQKHLLFRFSKHFGWADVDDLAGEPYYLQVKVVEDNRMQVVPVAEEESRKKSKAPTGIAYMLPGKIKVSLTHQHTTLLEHDFMVAQLGRVMQLPASTFTNKKQPAKAVFNAQSGAIKLYE